MICAVCQEGVLEPVLELAPVPVAGILWRSREEAISAPTGEMHLAVCPSCGVVRNTRFDPEVMAYTPAYENSQHFSPAFRGYATDLARRLVRDHGLRHKVVVEIGSGKGEFLAMLCEEGDNRGLGFDPSYDGESDGDPAGSRIEFVREHFSPDWSGAAPDLVCCRHVLEHVDDAAALVSELQRALRDRGAPVYFEVPNAVAVFDDPGLWDVIYPHVWYFSAPNLRWLFERCGFDVQDVRTGFRGQFLSLEATPGEGRRTAPGEAVDAVVRLVRAAGERHVGALDRWNDAILERPEAGGMALWGAGSKGVTLLNATAAGSRVDVVVDVNPRKHGSFIPGTGQPVVAPEELRWRRPATVVITNPAYRTEIRRFLHDLGLDPEILSVAAASRSAA